MAENTKIIISAQDRTRAAFRSAEGSVKRLAGDMRELRNVGRILIGAQVLGKLAQLGRAAIDSADQLFTLSQQTKLSVEELSRLKFFAEQNETSLGSFTSGLKFLSRQMFEAAKGTGKQAALFDALGIAVKNTDGTLLSSTDVLKDIGVLFSSMEDGATKNAIAVKLLGRGVGIELVPALSRGATAMADSNKKADEFGITMATESAVAADEFKDSMNALTAQLSAFVLSAITPAIKGLNEFIRATADAINEGSGLLRVFSGIGSGLAEVARGNDQQRLGEMLLKEIKLRDQIAQQEKNTIGINKGSVVGLAQNLRLSILRERLAATLREQEGLKVALPPEKQGAAPPAPAPRKTTVDEAAILAALQNEITAREGVQSAAEKQAEAIAGLVDAAKVEAETYGKTARQVALYQAAKEGANKSQLAQISASFRVVEGLQAEEKQTESLLAEQEKVEEATQAAVDKQRTYIDGLDDQADAVRDVIQPMRPFVKELEKIRELLDTKRINIQEFNLAVTELGTRMTKAARDIENADSQVNEFAREAARNIQSALADFLFDPFADGLRGMVDGLQRTVTRMAADIVAAQLAKKLFGDFGSDSGDVGGLVGGLLKSVGGFFTKSFHTGGIIGSGGRDRMVPALAFAGAPRFHSGGILGLAPNEVPIIGQAGEEVLTRDDPRHRDNNGGRQSVVININNPRDAQDVIRSRSQIESQLRSAAARGVRNS